MAATSETRARIANGPRKWIAVAIAVLVLLGVVAVAFGPARSLLSPPGSSVAEFAGNGNLRTASFEVREGWAIHWESSGRHFAFSIGGDRDFGTVIDVNEPGSGVTSPVGHGRFYIDVQADAPWTLRVTQGD